MLIMAICCCEKWLRSGIYTSTKYNVSLMPPCITSMVINPKLTFSMDWLPFVRYLINEEIQQTTTTIDI